MGLFSLHALENENTVRDVANCNISVASEWIVRTGMQYREARNGEPMLRDDPSMKITGPL